VISADDYRLDHLAGRAVSFESSRPRTRVASRRSLHAEHRPTDDTRSTFRSDWLSERAFAANAIGFDRLRAQLDTLEPPTTCLYKRLSEL
jgi:hypothetical protein